MPGTRSGTWSPQGVAGGETKGLTLGWDPTLSVVLAILLAAGIGLLFGAVASRSFGIYFLMLTLTYSVIAYLFVSQVTQVGGFSPIAGIDRYTPGFVGDVVNDRQRLYYVALGVAHRYVYVVIRYLVRTPFGIALQGIRDEPVRMASLGYNVALHRTLAFGIGALVAAVGGVLFALVVGPALAFEHRPAGDHRAARDRGDRGADRIEGAWLGAFAYIVINNEVTNRIPSDGLPVIGGSFNTVIGLVFLAIVIVSPDGLMGIWDRLWGLAARSGAGAACRRGERERGELSGRRERRLAATRCTTGNGIHQVPVHPTKEGREMRRPQGRIVRLLASVGLLVAAIAAITSASSAAPANAVRVAIMGDCKGAFGFAYELDIGGAQTAFAQFAGGKAKNKKKPSAGMTGIKAGGKNVNIVGYGCGDDTPATALKETRRLMQQLKARRHGRAALGRRGGRDRQLGEAAARRRP